MTNYLKRILLAALGAWLATSSPAQAHPVAAGAFPFVGTVSSWAYDLTTGCMSNDYTMLSAVAEGVSVDAGTAHFAGPVAITLHFDSSWCWGGTPGLSQYGNMTGSVTSLSSSVGSLHCSIDYLWTYRYSVTANASTITDCTISGHTTTVRLNLWLVIAQPAYTTPGAATGTIEMYEVPPVW